MGWIDENLGDWIHRQLNQFGNVAISGPFGPISAVSDAENVNYWPLNEFEHLKMGRIDWKLEKWNNSTTNTNRLSLVFAPTNQIEGQRQQKNVLIMKLIDNWFKCDFLFSWFAFNGDGRRGWATASMTSTTSSTSKCPHCWKPTTTTTVSTPTIGPTPNSPVSFVNQLMTWISAH